MAERTAPLLGPSHAEQKKHAWWSIARLTAGYATAISTGEHECACFPYFTRSQPLAIDDAP